MRKKILVLALLAVAGLSAETTGRGKRIWRWSLAMVAAANVADGVTSMGRHELNPVLGTGRFGARAAGVKIGVSTATIGVQYLILRRRPEAARKAAFVNFAMAGLTGGIAARTAAH